MQTTTDILDASTKPATLELRSGSELSSSVLLYGEQLRVMPPEDFVRYVRSVKKAGLLQRLCDLHNSKWGAGVSNTRQLGNLCENIFGREKRDEYLAAFFAV